MDLMMYIGIIGGASATFLIGMVVMDKRYAKAKKMLARIKSEMAIMDVSGFDEAKKAKFEIVQEFVDRTQVALIDDNISPNEFIGLVKSAVKAYKTLKG